MSTRSRIAIQLADKTFKSIYAHWDGYPDHNGRILQEHYTDPAKVSVLINLGSVSSLGPDIGTDHDFNKSGEGVCTFYGRDRGETDVAPKISRSLVELNDLTQQTGGEWLYVFMDGAWWVGEGGIGFFGAPSSAAPGDLKLLTEVLEAL